MIKKYFFLWYTILSVAYVKFNQSYKKKMLKKRSEILYTVNESHRLNGSCSFAVNTPQVSRSWNVAWVQELIDCTCFYSVQISAESPPQADSWSTDQYHLEFATISLQVKCLPLHGLQWLASALLLFSLALVALGGFWWLWQSFCPLSLSNNLYLNLTSGSYINTCY